MTGGSTRENLAPPPFADAPMYDHSEAESALDAALTGTSEDTIRRERPAADDAPAPSQRSSPDQGDDGDPPEGEAPADDQGDDTPDAPAPVEPPRSWSKEARERWSSLPRETQEFILRRETERDAEVRRGQNEAAELRKAAEAEKQALATERQRYVEKLPQLIALASADLMGGEYARMTPEQRIQMSQTDPARLLQLREAHEAKAGQVHQLLEAQREIQTRQQAEAKSNFEKWADEQEKLAREHVPEFFDTKSGAARKAEAMSYLKTYGFTDEDIGAVRDHRMLRVIADAIKGRAVSDKRAIAEQKVQGKPRVATPGVAGEQPGIGMSPQKQGALIRQLRSTDNTFDQAKVLEQLL